MEVILHRINKIEELKTVSHLFGVEIDIRTYGDDLILRAERCRQNCLNGDSRGACLCDCQEEI